MSFIKKCDSCGTVYEQGFNSRYNKVITFKKLKIDATLEIRPPHLCSKCLRLFLDVLVKDIRGAYK